MEDDKKLSEKVSSLEDRVSALEALINNNPIEVVVSHGKKLSIKEFILSKRPSGDVQKALAIAYYLEKHDGMDSFNVEDLARGFQLAKESTPANVNDKINMNIKKGHIAEAGEKKGNKKAWIVTNSGEKFVDDGFKEPKE